MLVFESQIVTLYARFAAHLDTALDALEAEGALAAGISRAAVTVEPPRDPSHGDLATNAAMVLAKPAGTNPRALADLIVAKLRAFDEVASADIAGPASSTSNWKTAAGGMNSLKSPGWVPTTDGQALGRESV